MDSTSIYYFVQGDGDDPLHLNMYRILKPASKVTVKDIRQTFPIPGKYHFRFKIKFDNGFIWLDLMDENKVVPIFEGRVNVKVARLSTSAFIPSSSQSNSMPSSNTREVPMDDLLMDPIMKPNTSVPIIATTTSQNAPFKSTPQSLGGMEDIFGPSLSAPASSSSRLPPSSRPKSDLDDLFT